MTDFKSDIIRGIPDQLPKKMEWDDSVSHAPKRNILNTLDAEERALAIENALRYFPSEWHDELAEEFAKELDDMGRIYMYRFRPQYDMYARPIEDYPSESKEAAAIMLMMITDTIMKMQPMITR